mgnify:CR=1 FL=1
MRRTNRTVRESERLRTNSAPQARPKPTNTGRCPRTLSSRTRWWNPKGNDHQNPENLRRARLPRWCQSPAGHSGGFFLSDGSEATAGADYTAEYADELLTLSLSGSLAGAEAVKIQIGRNMYGRVKIVPICAGGQIPSEEVLADVLAACSADDVRPLTDMVTVEAPETHEYDIELTYYTTKANESEAVQNVEGSGGAIDQYINWQGSTLNQDINPDELRKRILCPDWADDLIGATRVQIIKPEYTELNSTTVAKFSGKKTVKHIVKG